VVGIVALVVVSVALTVSVVGSAGDVATGAGIVALGGELAADGAADAAVDGAADAAADATTEGADDAADEGADDLTCAAQSFTPGTGVVLASGASVPIASITVGTKVAATNPATGVTTGKTVAHVWVDRDDDLMDVTVVSHGTPSVVHTTAHHPFWDATRHAWVEADRLTPGDQLRSVDGATVTYTSETVVPGTADMWDLTITSDHDFYIHTVDAGTVLVHNCPPSSEGSGGKLTNSQMRDLADRVGYRSTPYRSNGQAVFTNGKNFITQDIDSHGGGVFKMASTVARLGSKATRMGTYDVNLFRILE
jgi:hypothetical protein